MSLIKEIVNNLPYLLIYYATWILHDICVSKV